MVLTVISNIIAQIMFFIINIFIIDYATNLIINKYADYNVLVNELNKAIKENNLDKTKKLYKKFNFFVKYIYYPTDVIISWTSGLLINILAIPVMYISCNHPRFFECSIDKEEVKGKLTFGFQAGDSIEKNWWNPWKQLGRYIVDVMIVMIPMLIPVAVIYLFLPSTFYSVVSNINQWTELQSGIPNLAFFRNMVLVLKDIIWDRLVMGAINENLVWFAVYVIAIAFIFSNAPTIKITQYVDIVDQNGEVIEYHKLVPYESVYTWLMIALLIIVFNVVFALVCPALYNQVSYFINSIGMIILLIILVSKIAAIVRWCFSNIIGIVMKIKG